MDAFPGTRLFVLGNASIDTTLRVPRLPEAGETLMATGILRSPGGKGLNQAVMAARCGVAVHFCAPLGREPETALIRAALAEAGLASCALPDPGQPTDLSSLMVSPDGENCIVSTGACAAALDAGEAAGFLAPMQDDDWLLLQGNLSLAVTRMAAARARQVVLNTAPLRWDYASLLPHCAVVVANRPESRLLTGEDDPARAAHALAARAGQGRGGMAVVTLGAAGCMVAGPEVAQLPPPAVVAVDSSGAGDVFCGVLAAGLTRGLGLIQAVGAGQRAAALSVSRAGCYPSFPSGSEMATILLSVR